MNLPRWLAVYLGYCFLIHVVSAHDLLSFIPFGVVFQYFAYAVFLKNIVLREFTKYYKIIAGICIAFFFIQEWTYYTTGYRIGGILRFLPLSLDVEDASSYYESVETMERSASFFSEPAHFVQFLLPLFAIILFDKNRVNRVWVGVIFIVLLLLQSGNAVFGLAAVACIYVLKILKNSTFKTKFIALSGVALIFFAVFAFFVKSEMGQKLSDRQDELNGDIGISSGFIRIFRGYYVFDAYSPIEKVFGLDNDEKILLRTRQSTVGGLSDFGNELYFNGVQSILIRTGYIGMLLFVMMLISIWKGNDYRGKAILLIFVVYSFISAVYFSRIMAVCLIAAYKIQQENRYSLLCFKR